MGANHDLDLLVAFRLAAAAAVIAVTISATTAACSHAHAGGRYLSDSWALNLENLTWKSFPPSSGSKSGGGGGPSLLPSSAPAPLPAIAGHVAVAWQGNVVVVGGHLKVCAVLCYAVLCCAATCAGARHALLLKRGPHLLCNHCIVSYLASCLAALHPNQATEAVPQMPVLMTLPACNNTASHPATGQGGSAGDACAAAGYQVGGLVCGTVRYG